MKDKCRPGRGLEEVSQFYLTCGRTDGPVPPCGPARAGTVIKVYHPGSFLMQTVFLVNFALELARNRFAVAVWDCPDRDEASAAFLMKSLIPPGRGGGSATAKVYGLPDIVVYDRSRHSGEILSELADAAAIHERDNEGCLLVNTPGSLAAVGDDGLCADCIFMVRADEDALLACYAFIKLILSYGGPGEVFLVFDDPGDGHEAEQLSGRFARFVETRLHRSVCYLGAVHHDEYLLRSVEQSRPLMLFHEHSRAKEDLALISRNYLDRRPGRRAGKA